MAPAWTKDSSFTKDIHDQMSVIISQDRRKKGVNTIFKEAVDFMLQHKLAWKNVLNVSTVFVHPKNRSGLGLSWHNVHRNGDKIVHAGADMSVLTNAYAFEMNPSPCTRTMQEDFNVSLINRSKGLLAEATGHERYLSVGCGHTTAFCHAAAARCITTFPKLADEFGRIDANRLHDDKALSKMITEGWQ